MRKKIISVILAFSMVLGPGTFPAFAAENDVLPSKGDKISGFVLEDIQEYSLLDADILSFRHEVSGAQLCYIKNDDTNRAFSIGYRTPTMDESDINHVFEHSIIASSEKYPSKNLAFDMIGKTYCTYINAYTYIPFTYYPVSSQSEEQLVKMADAYMSCMVSPGVLKDENFFRREAIRYMLYDEDEPITMGGTVFTEDEGYLTDIKGSASSNLLDVLYPGEYASNSNGLAFYNYKDLTYDKVANLYESCYNFDNSLIILYGDLDYKAFLKFLDSEYLSKYPDTHTDLSPWEDPKTAPGFKEELIYSPAYQGSSTENASVITYGLDLDGKSWRTLLHYNALASLITYENSVFYKNLNEAGIPSSVSVRTVLDTEKPIFVFELDNADPGDAEAFRQAVDKTLYHISVYGFDGSMTDRILKLQKLNDYNRAESLNSVTEYFMAGIMTKWAQSGETDYLTEYDAAFGDLHNDEDQTLIRSLAAGLLECENSALVTTVPKPGLAEELLAEQEAYLAEMKASMTSEELEQMIEDTLAFDQWNDSEMSNSDFMISVSDLPDPPARPEFSKEVSGTSVFYFSGANRDGIVNNKLMLDTSSIPQEDLYYLLLYSILISNLDTENLTRAQINEVKGEYLNGFWIGFSYPDSRAGNNSRPFLVFNWTTLSEDHENSLELLTETISASRFDNKDMIAKILDATLPSMDPARSDPFETAQIISLAGNSNYYKYYDYLTGQGAYGFLSGLRDEIAGDPGAMGRIAEKLEQISKQVYHSDNMIFSCVASSEDIDALSASSRRILSRMPSLEAEKAEYDIVSYPQKTGIITEDSLCYTFASAPTPAEDISGALFPFISALSDKYIVPEIRFKGLAYSAQCGYYNFFSDIYFFSHSDPNVSYTMEIIENSADYLITMDITQSELDGYILNAYSSATPVESPTQSVFTAISNDIINADTENYLRLINELKTATVHDREKAAGQLRSILKNLHITTVGNGAKIIDDADSFDKIYDHRTVASQEQNIKSAG